MSVLRIEHAISDYDMWKAAFDRDPANRKQSGVRRYAIHRPVEDPRYVMIDLEFDDVADAEAMLTKLEGVWKSPEAAPALAGQPKARVLETLENADL